MSHSLPILKGPDFAQRLREVCREPLARVPLDDLRYQRILIPGLCGGEVQFALLGLLAQALRIRGADVTALMCDALLPACTLRKVDHHESACTRWCHRNSGPFASAMSLPHRWYSEFIDDQTMHQSRQLAAGVRVDELSRFRHRDLSLGGHVVRSLESFYKIGRVDLDRPEVRAKAREFVQAAIVLTEIGFRALQELRIDKVVLEDGQKTDWGVIRDVARHLDLPIDLIVISPRGQHVLIEWDRPGRASDAMPSWPAWRDTELTAGQEAQLTEYLQYRELVPLEGTTLCSATRPSDARKTRRSLGLAARRRAGSRVFTMFPNVGYDAGLGAYRPAFASADDWILGTVEWFAGHPEHQLVVRAHPGEAYIGACDSTADLLAGGQAPNVHVVPPDSPLTAHSVLAVTDVALVYTSTVAAEAVALGTPVVLAGGGWHSGRGVTLDASSPAEYFTLLAELTDTLRPLPAPGALGRRYAYAFFIGAALPIEWFRVQDINVRSIDLSTINDLAPDRNQAMDAICRSILVDELPGEPDAELRRSDHCTVS